MCLDLRPPFALDIKYSHYGNKISMTIEMVEVGRPLRVNRGTTLVDLQYIRTQDLLD